MKILNYSFIVHSVHRGFEKWYTKGKIYECVDGKISFDSPPTKDIKVPLSDFHKVGGADIQLHSVTIDGEEFINTAFSN